MGLEMYPTTSATMTPFSPAPQWGDLPGLAAPEMLAYFVLTSGVAAAVLFVLERSQDILWLGGVHYLMDVAIDAFS